MWSVSRTTSVDESFEGFFRRDLKVMTEVTLLALLHFLAASGVCSPFLDLGCPILGSSFSSSFFFLVGSQVSNKYSW